MKIEFHASIKIDPDRTVRFTESIKYQAPSGVEVLLENHDKDSDVLIAKLTLEADSLEEAQPLAEAELIRLTNVLAWRRQMKILNSRINGYQYSERKGQQNAVVLAETIRISEHLAISVTIGKDGVKLLGETLANEIDDQLLDLITLWRDAFNESSDITRYFFLYRILEGQLGQSKDIDEWIRNRNPNVEQRQTRGNKMVTIYTYLRDNIHPKKENQRFPFKDVSAYVNKLQELVKDLIIEKFPESRI